MRISQYIDGNIYLLNTRRDHPSIKADNKADLLIKFLEKLSYFVDDRAHFLDNEVSYIKFIKYENTSN